MDTGPAPVTRTRRMLPGDNPQAYLPGDRRRALARGEDLPARTTGSALFVDISGFTPLTEALARELGGRRGAEELTATLDRVFAALLERLHVWRGSVIYFSGDAVTAWIDGDDGAGAVACGLEMQDVMAEVGRVTTPLGSQVRLGVKVAVAHGDVHRFVVGDPEVQVIDVLAGALMDSLAAAEGVAEPGDVVLDAGATAALGERVRLRTTREGTHGAVGVVDTLLERPAHPGAPLPEPVLPDELVRPWLLPPVWDRMAAGRGELLAELRPAVPMFIRFGGLDVDHDPSAPERLDAFVRRTQRVFAAQGGYVLQLTIGDKGAYLYAVFGSPLAHEDDTTRACEAALDLTATDDLTVTDVQIGIATGRLRSGTYGHRERRTFCCLGDAVNLAARLMSAAPAGSVYVHGDVAAATGHRFRWQDLPAMTVKGKSRAVAVRALEGRARRLPGAHRNDDGRGTLVGREAELARLRQQWRGVEAGEGRTVVVHAEAGTGKSRLVAELVADLRAAGTTVASGEAPSVGGAAYAAWHAVWADLLDVDPETAGLRDVSTAVAALDPRLVNRAPLLGAVLGTDLPDSELTASFSAELRKSSLEDLLARLLRARAARAPLAIVLEDAHWADPLSRDLLAELARAGGGSPVLLLVTSRPDGPEGAPHAGLPVAAARRFTDVALGALPPEAAVELARGRFLRVTGQEPAEAVLDTVVARAEGNPFYLEQLVDYVAAHENADDPDALDLPASLHSLVLSRIDTQPEGPRQSVKVASVLGRSFRAGHVAGTYPDLGDEDDVDGHLLDVAAARIVEVEDRAEHRFAFGHAVTQEVAYASLPFSVRTVLHGRAGEVLEAEPDGARRHLELLVHHFTRSDDLGKQRHYLLAAAEAAQASYAMATAVAHLEQALPLVEPAERASVLLSLAAALETQGDWSAAEDAAARSLESAEDEGDVAGAGRARNARAELARKQGRYAEALAELDAAEAAFTDTADEAGLGRVLHLRGTVAAQQGDPDAARAAYTASLAIRERLGDDAGAAAVLTNLGIVAENEGELDEAERIVTRALELLRQLPDRRVEAISLINFGMLALEREEPLAARDRFAEARRLADEVGDPWVVAIVGHNQGNVERDLGDPAAAAPHLLASLEGYAQRADQWYLAQLFEDLALWLLARDDAHDPDAVALLEGALRVREVIGAPRKAATEAELAAALAPVHARLDAASLTAAREQGRAASVDDLVDRARLLLAG